MELSFQLYFSDETIAVSLSSLIPRICGDKTLYETSVRGAQIQWCFEKAPLGKLITLSIESDHPLDLHRIDSLRFDVVSPKATDRIPFFGNFVYNSEHRYPCDVGCHQEYCSDGTGLFPDLASSGFALVFVPPFQNIVGGGVKREGDLFHFFAKTEFTDGQSQECRLVTDPLYFSEDITIQQLFDVYRPMLPVSHFPMPKLTGWNSWDYYIHRVTPQNIFDNVEALSKMPFADQLKYIVIDDGWKKEWGEWVENEKFACGMQVVADKIRQGGFEPGIWTAPLIMKDTCADFESRMHWFVKNAQGEYIRSEENSYVIDPTLPEAEEFILDIYRRLYGYGYRLFKIDYLTPLKDTRHFHDPSATYYTALSNLILKIQNVTGEDAVILGCSLPLQCGADIAPSMRIGMDIHNHHSHTVWCTEILTWTWMYNNRNTRIDPDFMVVRGLETADEPLVWFNSPNYTAPKRRCDITSEREIFRNRWRQGDQFNAVEAETWAYLVALSGGNIFLSDNMTALNQKGISIIDKAIRAAGEECRPFYLHSDKRLPSLWRAEGKLLVINWEDTPETMVIDIPETQLVSDKPFTLENGKLTVTLLPHESFYAEIQ